MGKPRMRKQSNAYNVHSLTPLIEGPEIEEQCEKGKKEKSWDAIRAWVHGNVVSSLKRVDLRLILGVLGCPLSPIPCLSESSDRSTLQFHFKHGPLESRSARYIIHQYLAATGCTKIQHNRKSMYATGSIKLAYLGDIDSGTGIRKIISNGDRSENGCFVLWQMSPGMWLVELVVGGHKVVAGCNGKVVWRHLPWLGTNAARGPQRPLRRIIQGLDPNTTASMFANAQCLGEKRIGDDDCFVLKVSADRTSISERNNGHAEVIRHVLYGYFSQKSGFLMYIEDSHLTRVQTPSCDTMYWETTIGTTIEDYKEVNGVLIAHKGRSVATIFRFGEALGQNSRSMMEEIWMIDDVAFNVPGLSLDCFIPPTEISGLSNGL